jgi:putative membrane protein
MRPTLFFVPLTLMLAGGAWAADTDAEFVKKAASGGLMEVELGRHASQHATNPSVRTFGQRMVADHGKANAELAAIARRQGLTVPTQMEADHREQVDELTQKSGAAFDEAYMELMVEDHEHDVDAFREQAAEAKTEVDRFAAKTLPTLEAHLTQAKAVEDALDARSGASQRGEQ